MRTGLQLPNDQQQDRGIGRRLMGGMVIFAILLSHPVGITLAGSADNPLSLIGPKDALMVTSPDGAIVFSKNEKQKQVPASILKLLTALAALHYLGPDFRFPTDFFIDSNQDLKIKGYGDPLLISEIIDRISRNLSGELSQINNIILDDRYFSQPVLIPGRTASHQPYNAPNGALCANFNTVNFKVDNKGQYTSAEKQTPLIPFVVKRLRASRPQSGRIVFSHRNSENVLYTGHLFRHFLTQQGIHFRGTVKTGRVLPATDRLILRHVSSFNLETIISRLLEFSNNFIANQLLIAVGAEVYGPPGNISKGVQATVDYAKNVLGLTDFNLVEGSGISRQNRISALDMIQVLGAFEPFRHLMPQKGREYYKTGTLNGIRTRAGYIKRTRGGRYRFVVMMNTKGKSAKKVAQRLLKRLP